jgi:hypothetical protein
MLRVMTARVASGMRLWEASRMASSRSCSVIVTPLRRLMMANAIMFPDR